MAVLRISLALSAALTIAGCSARIDALTATASAAGESERHLFADAAFTNFDMPGQWMRVEALVPRSAIQNIESGQIITYGVLVRCSDGERLAGSFDPQVLEVRLAEHEKLKAVLDRDPQRQTFPVAMLMFVEARHQSVHKCLTFSGSTYPIGYRVVSRRTPVRS